jgi:hypothetical protein
MKSAESMLLQHIEFIETRLHPDSQPEAMDNAIRRALRTKPSAMSDIVDFGIMRRGVKSGNQMIKVLRLNKEKEQNPSETTNLGYLLRLALLKNPEVFATNPDEN